MIRAALLGGLVMAMVGSCQVTPVTGGPSASAPPSVSPTSGASAPTGFQEDAAQSALVAQYTNMPSVPFTIVTQGSDRIASGDYPQPPVTGAFQSNADREAFVRQHGPTAGTALPMLDFERETGLVVTSGDLANSGNELRVVSVHDAGDEYVVYAIVWEPHPMSTKAPMSQNLYVYLKTSKLSKQVRFAPVLKTYHAVRSMR